MLSQAFNAVFSAASSVLALFTSLLDKFGFGGMLLTLFTIYTVCRLLLVPLFGAALRAGSDTVSRRFKDKKTDS